MDFLDDVFLIGMFLPERFICDWDVIKGERRSEI